MSSTQIDDYIASQSGWQKDNLVFFRKLVHEAIPDVNEEWKWSVPVFTSGGKLICAMSTFKEHTKFNFFEGAQLRDPHDIFNSGLDSKQHRSINLSEGEQINETALRDIISQATELARGS